MDVLFWPFVDLMVFGFLSIYMLQVSNAVPALVTFLIGAAILWNVFFRSQQAICIMFLDDVWSRNLLNVFAGPIRASEYVAAELVNDFETNSY
jgi:ABC-2 type transport system permease protein